MTRPDARLRGLNHLAPLAGRDLVDEAAELVFMGDEPARFDPGDRPTNIGVDDPERLERERRADTGLVLDRGPQVVAEK